VHRFTVAVAAGATLFAAALPGAAAADDGGYRDRSGLTEHVIRGGLEGAIVGGFAGYALAADHGAAPVVASALVGGAAGTGLALWLARGRDVRTGDVVLINAAENWGLFIGFAVPVFFQLRNHAAAAPAGAAPEPIDRHDLRLDLGVAAAASVAAGAVAVVATYAAPGVGLTPGQAATVGSGVIWGGLAGALLGLALAPEPRSPAWNQATAAAVVVGSTGGALGAWALRHGTFDVERGRAVALDVGVGLGLGAGLGLELLGAWLLDHRLDDERLLAGAALTGGVVGGAVGWRLSRGVDDFKVGAPAAPAAAPALVGYHGGRWSVGLPAPRPLLLPARSGVRLLPGLSLAAGQF